MENKVRQKNFFEKNGYIKISGFFSKSEIGKLKSLVSKIQKLKPEKGKHMIYTDQLKNKTVLSRTENFFDYEKGMKKFLNKKKIKNLLKNLTGSEQKLFKDKIIWKYPGAKGFEPHQDAQVWENLYKNVKSFVSLTISVDRTTVKNGCLEIAKEKHTEGLLGDSKSAIPYNIVKKLKWKKITTKPGDLIIFGAYTPHRSKQNKSNRARRMMYLTYNAKKDGNLRKNYYVNKRISFPPNNERLKGKQYKYLI